ncbi:MAG: DUF2188 domain-containing protein [Acholeplasma sp.]|jgi:hypothetical protein|nr:DUF2188 domain-containing protein [Acholeplasma sp.]
MQDFIIENGIYILIGLVLIFVVVTFLLSRKPEKQDKPVVPVNKESEPVEPEKVEEQPEVVENVVVEAPVTESVPEVIETPVKQVEEPIVEPTPEVKPKVVEEPKPEAVKPKAKPASEPKPKVAKPKSEPVKAPAAPASEPVDEDADEEAALKRVVKNPKYHISMNKDDQSPYFKKWRVRKEGSTKTIKYFDTQKEAITYATDLAEKANTSVVIHKVDGSIRKQDYSKK